MELHLHELFNGKVPVSYPLMMSRTVDSNLQNRSNFPDSGNIECSTRRIEVPKVAIYVHMCMYVKEVVVSD